MTLVKEQCKKEGYTKYTDLYLLCDLDGVKKYVRIRPVFWHDMSLLKKLAEEKSE